MCGTNVSVYLKPGKANLRLYVWVGVLYGPTVLWSLLIIGHQAMYSFDIFFHNTARQYVFRVRVLSLFI